MLEKELVNSYRRRFYCDPQEAYDAAQLAILDVIQAFRGMLPEEEVLKAIEDGKTPNAVSIAVRYRLSPI